MSILTVVQSKASNDYKAATVYKYATFAAACTVGNSVMICITALAAELPFVVEPEAWNGTAAASMGVPVASDTSTAGMTRYWYKLDNIASAIISIRYKVNASSGSTQQSSTIYEIGNTGGAALTLRVDQKTVKSTPATSFSENFTTVSDNELALVNLRTNPSNPTTAATAPVYVVTHVNASIDDIYKADMGTAGSKSIAWSTTSSASMNVWIITFSNTSTTPTVTSITGSSVTEGAGTAVRFTANLSGTPGTPADYTPSFAGSTAVAGTDYDSNLANATYSAGLSYVGGNVRFTGVSTGTIDVATVDNLLDQPTRSLILTLGGTASTGGSILDNDPTPSITFTQSVTVNKGDPAVINWTLSAVSGQVTNIRMLTADGTRIAGVDYYSDTAHWVFDGGVTINGSNVLSIPAGLGSGTITIPTIP